MREASNEALLYYHTSDTVSELGCGRIATSEFKACVAPSKPRHRIADLLASKFGSFKRAMS
jgi:hypothetical protein